MRKISCRLFTYSNRTETRLQQRTSYRNCGGAVLLSPACLQHHSREVESHFGNLEFSYGNMPRFSHSSLRLTINIWLLLLREPDRDVWTPATNSCVPQNPSALHAHAESCQKIALDNSPKWWKYLEVVMDGICFCLITNLHWIHNLCILQVICIIKTIKGLTYHGN